MTCATCGTELQVGAWPFCKGQPSDHAPARTHNAEWSDADAVVVFRKPNGELSYPGRNDKATPKGCERIVMRSLRQVESFERQNGVRNEAMHFDRGTARGFDDQFRGERFN